MKLVDTCNVTITGAYISRVEVLQDLAPKEKGKKSRQIVAYRTVPLK